MSETPRDPLDKLHGTCEPLAPSDLVVGGWLARRIPEEGVNTVGTTTRIMTRVAHCPECGAEVRLVGRLLIGEVFGCGRCSAQLEVSSLEPLALEPFARVEMEEEDYV